MPVIFVLWRGIWVIVSSTTHSGFCKHFLKNEFNVEQIGYVSFGSFFSPEDSPLEDVSGSKVKTR
jgi:hypothetical protein